MIERALAKHLSSKPAFRNLVGVNGVFRSRIPQEYAGDVAVVLSRQGADRFNDLYGEAAACPADVQLDIVARSHKAAWTVAQVAEVVRDLISGYRGNWDDTYVHGCTIENEIEFAIPPTDSGGKWEYQWSYDLLITFTQTQPKLV